MLLTRIYLRHYKSFNYDYERKAKPNAPRRPWEVDEDGWQPFVRVVLEDDITAVVGANESGKSHLLDAVEILLGHREYDQNDFCRYSSLYSVEEGQRRWPQFAGLFAVNEAEQAALVEMELALHTDRAVLILRRSPSEWSVVDADGNAQTVPETAVARLVGMMPTSFRPDTGLPLPNSLSIRRLHGAAALPARGARTAVMQVLADSPPTVEEAVQALAQPLFRALKSAPAVVEEVDPRRVDAQQQLGEHLLKRIAHIDEAVFAELADVVLQYKEGTVSGLIQKMNDSLGRHLNLQRWWRQDRSFSLNVALREHELVFTIHDRTGTDYSFAERSTGLRYFLSYFVQLLAHTRTDLRPEILLMDEPDTYLSASGQQDLLRVLEHYARPEGLPSNNQVIYVTHSPFLLNKNAVRRARVIDKGVGEEGTRLVRDASQNRYEPLRSAIGAFVAETAFIGGTNLFVEGASDQIYLVEMSNRLRAAEVAPSHVLDLNGTTIVGAGSASQVPYMVYLARGQDEIKPPCVVLLDSDSSGQEAARVLRRGGPYRKQMLDSDRVHLLGDWATAHADQLKLTPGVTVQEIEDLLSIEAAVAAARSYATEFVGLTQDEAAALSVNEVSEQLPIEGGSLISALQVRFKARFEAQLDKAGFAKELTRLLGGRPADIVGLGADRIDHNFGHLIAHLADALREADRAEEAARRAKRLTRIVDGFLQEHPDPVSRDTADVLLREADNAAGESEQGDRIRAQLASIRRDFSLIIDPLQPVERYEDFRERLGNVRYAERLANQERANPSRAETTDKAVDGVPAASRVPKKARAAPAVAQESPSAP